MRSEEALMLAIARGEHAAFDELVQRYGEKLYRVAWRVVRERTLAQDVVQEVLLKVWSRPAWRPGGARPGTWLYRLTLNAAIDQLRRRRPEETLSGTEPGAPDVASGNEELAHTMHRLMEELPQAMREALWLCYFEGMSHAEAGAVLRRSAKAVESLLARGRRALRESFRRQNLRFEDLHDD